ncbi:G-alpha-domain-containing protein [Trametes cingulata]|nr:G-alpha-domain-containing protein [Trametes cingulata]
MQSSRYATDPDDPLTAALAPPPNESAAEREERLRREEEAKRISDEIDERLKQERAAWKRHKAAFKLLLLGQSESGKSTTLKNFQLAFAPNAWCAERASWRAVIQLNLVRSINAILDVLAQEMARAPSSGSATSPAGSPFLRPTTAQGRIEQQQQQQQYQASAGASLASSRSDSSDPSKPPLQFTNTHALLKLRLVPLRRVEADLKQLIGAATDEHAPDLSVYPSASLGAAAVEEANAAVLWDGSPARRRPEEFYVRAGGGWREALRGAYQGGGKGGGGGGGNGAGGGADAQAQAKLEDATEIIASCAEDMRALWADPVVREVLRRRKIRMEQSPGFFLDDIARIAERTYEPTDDDVVRARLRTLGVQEHRLVMERSGASSLATNDVAREWMIYDVGGSRTSRAAWFPYFDDANAILFLAPISCFDELLQEDRRVNRLEDSFLLWKAIVQSKLLAKCIIVLFLNKYDLLDKKLRSGIPVKKYLPSFGDRENSAPVLAQYLHQKFKDQHREFSPQPRRPFYGYVTTAINTKATTSTLAAVRDGILRHNLQKADFV